MVIVILLRIEAGAGHHQQYECHSHPILTPFHSTYSLTHVSYSAHLSFCHGFPIFCSHSEGMMIMFPSLDIIITLNYGESWKIVKQHE